MKTIEYNPNSFNTALDELVVALKTGGESTALDELIIALRAGEEIRVVPHDPYKELRKAQEEGKIVQYLNYHNEWEDGTTWAFTEPPRRYRINPDTAKMWQWVYRSQLGHVRITSEFFRSREEAEELYPYVMLLKRADWTEIPAEVEQ